MSGLFVTAQKRPADFGFPIEGHGFEDRHSSGLLGGAASDDEAAGADGALPDRLAPVLALVGALPPQLTERLLVELLARVVEPSSTPDRG